MRRVGPYELLQKIGSGGMAEVWMGKRRALGGVSKVVAVKLPTGQVVSDPKLRDMFLKEAELSMLLSHSTVVQVFDVGEHEGRPYMVMEWVDGVDLAKLRELLGTTGRGLPLPVAAFVIGEVLRALAYAHTVTHEGAPLGVVHRDVSPQNVLISVSGEVKLTDFGVARVAHEDTSGLHVKGKLRYMAPEQLVGESRAATVDLYAVGAMLHELMDGKKFRQAKNEAHMYGMALSGEMPVLSDPDVPRELDDLRVGLLQKEVATRIPSAERALELLMRWPGYANASLELARLCRSVMGVQAPRSGIYSTPGMAPPIRSTGTDTVVPGRVSRGDGGSEPSSVPTLTAARGPGSSDDRGAFTATVAAPGTDLDATRTSARGVAGRQPGGEQSGRRLAAAAFVGLVALVAGGALGTRALGWWGGPGATSLAQADVHGETDAVAAGAERAGVPVLGTPNRLVAPTQVTASHGADAPQPGSIAGADKATEAKSAPAPRPTKPADPGVEPAADPQSTDGPEPRPGPRARKPAKAGGEPAKASRAQVTFKASQFDFVWVKVKGRVLALEPNATAKLPAGKHPLYFRVAKDDAWERAGTIDLDADGRYEVRMRRPAGFAIEKQR